MSQTKISFESQDRIRLLLGPRDKYVRLIRDAVGVDVVLRGDELRLQGDEAVSYTHLTLPTIYSV